AGGMVAISGGRLPPIALTTNCPSCGVGLVSEELREQVYVCDCGHHFRMHADAWIALLADEGTWEERWAEVRRHDLLEWKLPKPYQETIDQAREEGLNESVRTGTAALAGRPVWLAVFDFRFVGGTLSIVAGERLARAFEQAVATRTPFILLAASGGARMQEGVLALMQMAKVNGALGRLHRAGVPYFSVLTDPTFGGTPASLALLADVNVAELARHPDRPYALDYIRRLAPDFLELHGDRLAADDPALVAGVGTWHDRTVMLMGHQKGRNLADRVARNWGMMHPEGYRKAMRLARQAVKFRFPIITLVDTPGAYPGSSAESHGIASAIAAAIMEWFEVPVRVVTRVIGG